MDKRTLLAIVLSVVVVSGSFVLQTVFFPTSPKVAQNSEAPKPVENTPAAVPAIAPDSAVSLQTQAVAPQTVTLENDVMKLTLSNQGAVATSILLKKHLDQGKPIDMVDHQEGQGDAFAISFGGFEESALHEGFVVSQVGPLSWKFTQNFLDENHQAFTMTKTFTLQKNEYLVRVDVAISSPTGALPVLSRDPAAYTLTYGPQMGPTFKKLDGSHEFRKYYWFDGKDRKEDGLNHETKTVADGLKWAAIAGKYFTVIGVPDGTAYTTIFSNKPAAGETDVSRLAFSRPPLKSSNNVDTFYFYVGPKEERVLRQYDDPSANGFGLGSLKLERAMEDNFLLGWLEVLLKWGLQGFYLLIPNWGVGIILLTLLIKLLTWPLTAKSFRANAAMQTLQPKLKEIQEKYKDDPKKLNEQMMALYQKEGVSPLGGCLPMVLQIPVFFALYSLFNTQFDLRGAMFIPGWIPDLSVADSVWHWGFALPIVGWTDLHILPFIMVGSQIWTSMLSQPASGMNSQMKIMTYGLPAVFFFMLYEMPSGLMVYWCVQNLLSVAQQRYINKHFRKVPPKAANPHLKLAPKKSGPKISK